MNKGVIKNNKLLISLVIADLLMVAVVIVLAWLAWQKTQDVAELSGQADVLNQKRSGLVSLRSAASDSQKVIDALFLNEKTKAALIDELEGLGAQAGVDYTLNNAEDQDGLKYDVTIKGSFADIYHFISLVENLPYQVTVESADLEKMPIQKDNKFPWSANLTINIANLSITGK